MVRAAIPEAFGWYVPEVVLDNNYFAERGPYSECTGHDEKMRPIIGRSDIVLDAAKIEKNTGGILERRRMPEGMCLADMGKYAFEKSGFPVRELGGIVSSTVSKDYRSAFPTLSAQIASRLGAGNGGRFYLLDVSAGCTGFMHALDRAADMAIKLRKPVAAFAAEDMTRIVDYGGQDRRPDVNVSLFGAGCGVVIMRPHIMNGEERRGLLASYFDCQVGGKPGDVPGIDLLFMDRYGFTRMPGGREVRKRGPRCMIEAVHGVMEIENENRAELGLAPLTKDDLDLVVPHQANGRMIDTVVDDDFPQHPERVYRNIARFGNMSSATVAVGLAEAREKKVIEPGSLVALTAVGSDMQWGGALLRL